MLNDKQSKSEASSTDGKDVNGALKELNGIKKLKSFDFDSSSGFVCDINTGICGPVNQKKEGKE
ncbi:hypothetical protein [Fredinandcohnia onubensis]|uniref:hypothetical protein n=1 Tax=Fredinandcohnia onubensis TaxID=1571209 RepID=UPI000C0BEAE8|nr:hypothetical protein [Fredinandcohnia onubensis]